MPCPIGGGHVCISERIIDHITYDGSLPLYICTCEQKIPSFDWVNNFGPLRSLPYTWASSSSFSPVVSFSNSPVRVPLVKFLELKQTILTDTSRHIPLHSATYQE